MPTFGIEKRRSFASTMIILWIETRSEQIRIFFCFKFILPITNVLPRAVRVIYGFDSKRLILFKNSQTS